MRFLSAVSAALLIASGPTPGNAAGGLLVPDDAGAVTGTVTLKGPVPEPKTFKTDGLGPAHNVYPDGVTYQPVDVDLGRRVRSALVYVKSGLEEKAYPPPKEPARMDVLQYQFRPRMLGMMVGQPLVITNTEEAWHAIHALPQAKGNKEFNTRLDRKGMTIQASFAVPEVAVRVFGDDLHGWEQGWIAVLPHPFYCVTDERGTYEIKGLPPGKYTIEAWQENCEPSAREMEVKSNGTSAVDLTLEAKRSSK
ncbi:MAG TPA: carboxypeptidase-like regulatory domain-containing protein [Planctomycetota bacterium]|nr:carboxypeptidase-like regulatory domain-containing protein [Planctomycetota bacterium]